MKPWIAYLATFAAAFAATVAMTPLAMRLARKTGMLDHPNTALKQHKQPIPYLGGLALFGGFAVALVAAKYQFFPHPSGLWPAFLDVFKGVYGILAGAFLNLVLGIIDDRHALSPKVKFLGQTLIAVLLVILGLHVRFIREDWLAWIVTAFWVVALSNAVNFIDIMDGLASGVSGIAALGFFAFSVAAGRPDDSIAALALAGACAGFLVYNFSPARVFMGDAGSLFLGFTLSAIAINLHYTRTNFLSVFSPILILCLPIFDMALMTLIRTRKGIAPWRGSPDHIPLRLRALGLSKVQTVLILYGATALACVLAWLLHLLKDSHAVLAWGALAVGLFLLGGWLMSIPMPHDRPAPHEHPKK